MRRAIIGETDEDEGQSLENLFRHVRNGLSAEEMMALYTGEKTACEKA